MKGRNFINKAVSHSHESKTSLEEGSPITSPLLKILRKKREQEAEQKEVKEIRRESSFSQLVKEMQMTDGKLKITPKPFIPSSRVSFTDAIKEDSQKLNMSINEEDSEEENQKQAPFKIRPITKKNSLKYDFESPSFKSYLKVQTNRLKRLGSKVAFSPGFSKKMSSKI